MTVEEILKKIREEVEEEKRNYKGPHCCLTMDAELSREGTVFYYDSKYREYEVKIVKSHRCIIMKYCISCGKKLPSSLRIKWAEIVMQEYGLLDLMSFDKKKIPQEFLTDEWWKKRNV